MSAVPVCLLAAAVLVLAEVRGLRVARAIAKTCASLAFVLAALEAGALDDGATGAALLVALSLSVVGDVLLLSRARRAFLAGLGAFLLAHLAYVATFALAGASVGGALGGGVAVTALCLGAWRWLGPRVGSMRAAVLGYVAAIGAMVAAAVGVGVAHPAGSGPWVPAGAALFLVSDLCVARDRFVAPGPANRVVGLPLYYVAQLLLAGAIPRL